MCAVPLTDNVAFVSFKSTTSPQSEKTYQLVRHLRSDTLPPLYAGTANHIYIYGDTAINVDFAKVLGAQDAAVHRGRRRAVVPAADDRVPQPRHPA